jgi:rubrerythrin
MGTVFHCRCLVAYEKEIKMAEYIEREALIAGIEKRLKNPVIIRWLCGIIGEQPAADVAPVVHGRWETVIDYDEFWGELDYYKCSVCGNLELRDSQTPYCPNCGARMDGE